MAEPGVERERAITLNLRYWSNAPAAVTQTLGTKGRAMNGVVSTQFDMMVPH
jgi:hypothetical protein